jgi:hypothetical protein
MESRMRTRWSFRVAALLLLASGSAAGVAEAQTRPAAESKATTAWTAAKTPWGDPDLQEIWSTEDLRDVPYERPDQFQGRLQLNEREFAEREVRTKRDQPRGQVGFANGSKTRTFRQTSLIVDSDGKYPRLTPQALQRFRITDIGTYGSGPFESAADFNLYDRCISRGVVGSLLPVAYGNGLQIFQTPSQVVINYEMVHETRIIPLDGRAHVGSKIKTYMGDARGHWEGQTLVVETTNFTNKTSVGRNGYGPHNSEALRLVERFNRVSAEQIDYEVSVTDPDTWVRPFKMAFPLTTHAGYKLFPYECHEGNMMLIQALSSARAEDQAEDKARARGEAVPPRPDVWTAPEGVQVPR